MALLNVVFTTNEDSKHVKLHVTVQIHAASDLLLNISLFVCHISHKWINHLMHFVLVTVYSLLMTDLQPVIY